MRTFAATLIVLTLLAAAYNSRMDAAGAAADPNSARKEQWETLAKRYLEVRDRYFTALETAKTDDERRKIHAAQSPESLVVDELFSFEQRWRGTDEGLAALYRIILDAAGVGDMDRPISKAREKTAGILLAHYIKHPNLDAAMRYWGIGGATSPMAESFLRGCRSHPSATVRAAATYRLASYLAHVSAYVKSIPATRALSAEIGKQDDSSLLDKYEAELAKIGFTAESADQKQQESLDLLAVIARDYPQVHRREWGQTETLMPKLFDESDPGAEPRTYGQLADSLRFELTSLQPGQNAPEIDAPDPFGTRLRLSQFRGKVVILTFSADWCGPCVAMYPQLRQLLETHGHDRLAVISVMNDNAIDTVRSAVQGGKITWPVWWDGEKKTTTQRWNVTSWPTVYVLDERGTVRYRDVRDELLTAAVKILVRGLPAATSN
jgi:thiol-disulfide isomerase/thioredoxin